MDEVVQAALNMRETAQRALSAARHSLDQAIKATRHAQANEDRARQELAKAEASLGPALEAANSILQSRELLPSAFSAQQGMAEPQAMTQAVKGAPDSNHNNNHNNQGGEEEQEEEEEMYLEEEDAGHAYNHQSYQVAAPDLGDPHPSHRDSLQAGPSFTQYGGGYQPHPQLAKVEPTQDSTEPPSMAGGIFATLFEVYQHDEFTPDKLKEDNLAGLTTCGKNKGAAFARLKDRGYVATSVHGMYRWCIPPPSFWDTLPHRRKDIYYRVMYLSQPDGTLEFHVVDKGVKRKRKQSEEPNQ